MIALEEGMAIEHDQSAPSYDAHPESLLLICWIGAQRFGIEVAAIERILPMAAITPLPDARCDVIGVINYRGTLLTIVDPHPRLGLSVPPVALNQHLLIVSAKTRYMLRLDQIERMTTSKLHQIDFMQSRIEQPLASLIAEVDGEMVPVLSLDVLDPGQLARNDRSRAR